MEDVQGRGDSRGIPINHAGVSDLTYPIVVLDRAQERQHTIAKIAMSVALPRDFKGTHMSRFIEVLEEHRGEVTMRTMPRILQALRERLQAQSARISVVSPTSLSDELRSRVLAVSWTTSVRSSLRRMATTRTSYLVCGFP